MHDETIAAIETASAGLLDEILGHDETPDPGEHWAARGLCAQTDPEAFFPEKGQSTREAKQICMACAVRVECLDWALTAGERFGIWGGLSERERRRIKRADAGRPAVLAAAASAA